MRKCNDDAHGDVQIGKLSSQLSGYQISFLLLIVLSYCSGHLPIRFNQKGANVIAVLAMVDLAGVASCFQVEFRAATDRTDLLNNIGLHDDAIVLLRSYPFAWGNPLPALPAEGRLQ